ncbi:hypothetical protein JYK02_39260 [Corallococcus macrosporus]|uniref:Uncharacterized protein n=1 Tax=Corallococcus macrosporus TaxID=35 RepID=A0ABS3DQG1_9BACT|nr:hypothetical protein [Corallococcus macrosporus]MBN8233578.1 hypothetical protein [Corallococcus macrosporus]
MRILTVEHLLGGEECHPLTERTVGSLGPSDVEHRRVLLHRAAPPRTGPQEGRRD